MSINPIYSKSKFWFAIGILEKQIGKNKYRPMLTELSFDNSIYTFICSTVTNLRKNTSKTYTLFLTKICVRCPFKINFSKGIMRKLKTLINSPDSDHQDH